MEFWGAGTTTTVNQAWPILSGLVLVLSANMPKESNHRSIYTS